MNKLQECGKHKIKNDNVYKLHVTLRVRDIKDDASEYDYTIYNGPWFDFTENTMSIAEVVNEYVEDLDYSAYDTEYIHTLTVMRGDDIVQAMTLNSAIITDEEIDAVKKKGGEQYE